ncbi:MULTISPECIES: HpcH/HpaI aldolase/citrate lyase family protein [Sphingobium]|uniref:Citryl-CoA lyase n=1 Tax=Sphingobium fuliginis (strain ATCC 27551) TaxID=336203 RepID=A0ABQ1FE65_SPHSA|nr:MULTISPECIES: CoA ester lyase [Sphingobium]AJR24860.1 citrate lyase [Sphingobium sp. YBL2]RYL95585.1 CoA ester lyase [Sphingobium fuliginis]WDA36960.1 CoA ester lyase [Sphingobium sp. YC-XJ3]GGA06790.1 citryl-CoA lyase [Sphingobium fuliginis]
MKLRSLLFVPADRPERFAKAAASGADAIILDLEDSVAPERKALGREAIAEWLASPRDCVAFVRVNPLDGDHTRADLAAVLPASPDGIMLPKAEGAPSIQALIALADGANVPPILPIATETPAAIFELGTFRQVREKLAGLTWGAEDLPASVGASTSREEDGRYTAPFELARSLTLFAAHAAGVPAIDTVFPRIEAMDDLNAYIGRARRDGFTGMMAIHPVQVAAINDGFTPSETEIARARAVIDAFAANPGAGVLKLDGKMIDRPHLVQAQRVLAAAE